ncbi:MAG: transporter related protein [Cryobacterium sp.]|jgi:putative ABC transport system ATP-binding protein|nr:transporter related protein [Cryobacterium sp.]
MTVSEIVRCEEVSHTYGNGQLAVVAVNGVSCVVEAGARIVLIGPSGSGKSTLLHMMAGLEQVSTGRMTWPALGGPPSGRPRAVGVIFQGPSLIPSLDVVENVALPLVLDGVSDHEANVRALEALSQLDLGWMADKLPDELSGGQSQRVAVARVIATTPALILADEPTGQLDHDSGLRVIDVLISAADHLNAALVISTHDVNIATRLAVRWSMHDGRLTTSGKNPAPHTGRRSS